MFSLNIGIFIEFIFIISLFPFLQFYLVVNRNGKVHYSASSPFSFFFFFIDYLKVWSSDQD